jgi:hypothetical protein
MAKISEHISREERAVTRLLRQRGTQQYFRDDGWTESPEKAKVFYDVVEAVEVCVQYHLKDVELAVRVRPGACDLFCTEIC